MVRIPVDWNSNNTEPSVVSQIKGYGWIKMIKPTYDIATRSVTSATYQLTPIGKAIYQRTVGPASVAATECASDGQYDSLMGVICLPSVPDEIELVIPSPRIKLCQSLLLNSAFFDGVLAQIAGDLVLAGTMLSGCSA